MGEAARTIEAIVAVQEALRAAPRPSAVVLAFPTDRTLPPAEAWQRLVRLVKASDDSVAAWRSLILASQSRLRDILAQGSDIKTVQALDDIESSVKDVIAHWDMLLAGLEESLETDVVRIANTDPSLGRFIRRQLRHLRETYVTVRNASERFVSFVSDMRASAGAQPASEGRRHEHDKLFGRVLDRYPHINAYLAR